MVLNKIFKTCLNELENSEYYDNNLVKKAEEKIKRMEYIVYIGYLILLTLEFYSTYLLSVKISTYMLNVTNNFNFIGIFFIFIRLLYISLSFSLFLMLLKFSDRLEHESKKLESYKKYNKVYKKENGTVVLGNMMISDGEVINNFFKTLDKIDIKDIGIKFYTYIDRNYEGVELFGSLNDKVLNSGKLRGYKSYKEDLNNLEIRYKEWLNVKYVEEAKEKLKDDIKLVKELDKLVG